MSADAQRGRGPRINIRRSLRRAVSGNRGDVIFRSVALGFTLLILVIAFLLVFEIWNSSRPSIAEFGFFHFPFSDAWDPVARDFGALHVAVGTIVSSFIAVVIAVPISIGIALFITELAPPWLRGPVAFLVDILAAIPSIVYGLWGFFVLVPFLMSTVNPALVSTLGWMPFFGRPQFGVGMFAAGVILAIMIVPIISAVTREVIAQVPREQPEAMLALGATRWETISKVILPFARTGIIGGVVLGLARAIGETMAVTMVIGNRVALDANILAPNSTMASLIASEFREATYSLYVSALIHVALVLMLISLFVNICARLLVWSAARRLSGAR